MNSNRSNTRMIVIANNFVLNEEWNEEIDKASSPHLEMLKKLKEKLKQLPEVSEEISVSDVMTGSINLARAINGMVIQIFPSGSDNADDIMMMIYYDNNPLSNDVITNFKKVYSNLVTGMENDAINKKCNSQVIRGALTLSESDFSDSNTLSGEDNEQGVAMEDIISVLPVDERKERRA